VKIGFIAKHRGIGQPAYASEAASSGFEIVGWHRSPHEHRIRRPM
jgi:hypothetical protein